MPLTVQPPSDSLTVWCRALGFDQMGDQLVWKSQDLIGLLYGREIGKTFAALGEVNSAAFLVDDKPAVYLFDVTRLSGQPDVEIARLRKAIWNQNLASVLLILRNDHLDAYASSPRITAPETLHLSDARDDGPWSGLEFSAGRVWERNPSWFEAQDRADQKLLRNIVFLLGTFDASGVAKDDAIFFLAQTLLICYLERRSSVLERDGDGLQQIFNRCDRQGLDRLISSLSNTFGGDFLSVLSSAPKWRTLSDDLFLSIGRFIQGEELSTKQQAFWGYDFDHLPAHLLGAVYEASALSNSSKGAHFTPKHLASLLVEQAFSGCNNPDREVVLDPACGSGVILCTALRYLVWLSERKATRRLSTDQKLTILTRQILGADVDRSAALITSFCLYLTVLDSLDSGELDAFTAEGSPRLPSILGESIAGGPAGDFFSQENPHTRSKRASIIVSNPPWFEPSVGQHFSYEEWARELDLPLPHRQIAAAFVFKACIASRPGCRISLILPSKLFLSRTNADFLGKVFEYASIRRLINLSDLRKVLFPQAAHPCFLLIGHSLSKQEFQTRPTLEYYTPKNDSLIGPGTLVVHPMDRAFISGSEITDSPQRLVLLQWGSGRDEDLLQRLSRYTNLKTVASTHNWMYRKGFHAKDDSKPQHDPGYLRDIPFLSLDNQDAERMAIVDGSGILATFPRGLDAIPSAPEKLYGIFRQPKVIFPDGTTAQEGVRACYSRLEFSFQHSVAAFSGAPAEESALILLTAYLRSSLVAYILGLTGYALTAERPRVPLQDVLSLPFIHPSEHPDEKIAEGSVRRATDLLFSGKRASEAREEIDSIISDYYSLSGEDRLLIEDFVRFKSPSMQPGSALVVTPMTERPSSLELSEYARSLSDALHRWMREGESKPSAAVLRDRGGIVAAIRVSLADATESRGDGEDLILDEIARVLNLPGGLGSLVTIPHITLASGKNLIIVKPMRRRYWLRSTALNDADRIVRELAALSEN